MFMTFHQRYISEHTS